MKIKIKIYGVLQEDKETVELTRRIVNFLQIAKIDVDGVIHGLFIDRDKKTLHLVKGG